jgi:uncharacterized membrane protein
VQAVFPLALGSAAAILLLACRVLYSGHLTYIFLAWNLFLAWLPLLLGALVWWLHATESIHARRRSSFVVWAVLGVWLLLFPNAPYILTDFVHLSRFHAQVPWWFDLLLVATFALTGLALGLLALRLVHQVVADRLGRRWGWATVLGVSLLTGLGVYLGRFLRWNSWDVLHRPVQMAGELTDQLLHPMAHPRLLAVTLGFAALVLGAYVAVWCMAQLHSRLHQRRS